MLHAFHTFPLNDVRNSKPVSLRVLNSQEYCHSYHNVTYPANLKGDWCWDTLCTSGHVPYLKAWLWQFQSWMTPISNVNTEVSNFGLTMVVTELKFQFFNHEWFPNYPNYVMYLIDVIQTPRSSFKFSDFKYVKHMTNCLQDPQKILTSVKEKFWLDYVPSSNVLFQTLERMKNVVIAIV